jgi:hypothetical protein
MYTQIVGDLGPGVAVLAHMLKLAGVYFNDTTDATVLDTFTSNSFFEDYYRPYIADTATVDMPAEVRREFISFLRNFNPANSASANKNDWLVFDMVPVFLFSGRLLFVEYSYADLSAEFPATIPQEEYDIAHNRATAMKEAAAAKGWPVIVCEYAQFVNKSSYRDYIFSQLGLSNAENFEPVRAIYHDRYAQQATRNQLAAFTDENPADGLS